MKISASFLTSKNIPRTLTKLNETDVDYIHVDVMDGKFVKRKSLPFKEMKNIYLFTSKRLDVHLMVKKPQKLIHSYASLNVEYLTIHIEIKEDIEKLLDIIKSYSIKCGLSIKPETDLEELYKYLDKIDLVLVMGVNPGAGGQTFNDEVLTKIKELKKEIKKRKLKTLISVDGGVNNETRKLLNNVDILVSGSYIVSSENYQEMIDSLR
jgi:ribulose-phosphate 3-epimerase